MTNVEIVNYLLDKNYHLATNINNVNNLLYNIQYCLFLKRYMTETVVKILSNDNIIFFEHQKKTPSHTTNDIGLDDSTNVTTKNGMIKVSKFKNAKEVSEEFLKEFVASNVLKPEKNLQKIDNLQKAMQIDKWYLVPFAINRLLDKNYYVPIVNKIHNDKENGQEYLHYHIELRFDFENYSYNFQRINLSTRKIISEFEKEQKFIVNDKIVAEHYGPRLTVYDKSKIEIVYLPGILRVAKNGFITPISSIDKSKIVKCLKKNICPHRGYNLIKEIPDENGVITCPLHFLKFKNGKLYQNSFEEGYEKEVIKKIAIEC